MKFFEWIKAMFAKLTKKTVSQIERLEIELTKYNSAHEKIKNAHYEYKGKQKYFQDKINEAETLRGEILVASKKCIETEDNSMLLRCKKEVDTIDAKIERLKKSLELANKLSDETYNQKNEVASKISELNSTLDDLKMKKEFENDVKKYSSVINVDGIDTEFEKIAKDIEIGFNASEIELNDIDEENKSVLDLVKDNGLDEFKEMVMSEKRD